MLTRRLAAIVGPTATGKSALGIAVARALDGEIVACDSTAVYRGIDIGTDKLPPGAQGGIAHHLVDVAEPWEVYSAARYAVDAAAAVRDIAARGRLPILVGGTGFYYRALVRGLFPGPARDEALRARLDRVASRRGPDALHRWLQRVDPASARRIQPRDRKRLVRALEVYLLTGRPLTDHFAQTASPPAGWSTKCAGCSRPGSRQPPTRSAAWCTGRWSSCSGASAERRRRASSSCARTCDTLGGSRRGSAGSPTCGGSPGRVSSRRSRGTPSR